jgi:hypothetical protein
MSEKETIIIDNKDVHQVEIKPITVLCPSAEMAGHKIAYPNRMPIGTEDTTYHASKVQKLHCEFEAVWRFFMSKISQPKEIDYQITADNIRTMGSGALHLMGLIDLSLKLQDQKIPMVWVYPETFLHPGWQVALADLGIFFVNRGTK